ncbi:PAP-specific phosphatase HAL2-like [Linum grandiflorum]
MGDANYTRELDIAVRAVHMACALCQRVQKGLVSHGTGQVKSKDDDSLVTVADWSVQATVSWILAESFGDQDVSIVAEEDVQTLSKAELADLLAAVTKTVNESLGEALKYGLQSPKKALGASQVLEAISRCNSTGGPTGRHWVLDPKGSGKAWMQPLIHKDKILEWPNSARQIYVSSIDDPGQATFCEPVEKANSNHSFTAGVAHSMGFIKQPLRVHSMVKYAAIARGDAEIFMKFARSGYKEKIWDHAAGVVIVEEAGGVVTDAGGRRLDFSRGIYLEGLDRGIVACCSAKLHEGFIGAVYASWDSSNL